MSRVECSRGKMAADPVLRAENPGRIMHGVGSPWPVTPMRFPAFLALSLGPLLLLEGGPAVPADCNQNGMEDFQEIASGRSPDCNSNRVPDGCDILPVNYGPA